MMIIAAVNAQGGEMGEEAGRVVHGRGKGDMGAVLVPWPGSHLGPKFGGRWWWGTSEVLFQDLRVTPPVPASCRGDLNKARESASLVPAALSVGAPPVHTGLRQADCGLDWQQMSSCLPARPTTPDASPGRSLSELPAGGQDELEGPVVPRCPWPAGLLSV